MASPTERDIRLFHNKKAKWADFWSRHGYETVPDLHGTRVLDVGTGRGGNAVAAAEAGAQVVSLDPYAHYISLATELTNRFHADLAGWIEYLTCTVEEYDGDAWFDYIICDEVFEHIIDLPRALARMAELLKPGGKLLSGWGPLWHSPIGGHRLTPYLQVRPWPPSASLSTKSAGRRGAWRKRVPFMHRVFTRRYLRELSEAQGKRLDSVADAGMNGLTASQFRKIIEDSPLEIIRWEENVGRSHLYTVLRMLTSVPGLRNHFTSNVYAILSLPAR